MNFLVIAQHPPHLCPSSNEKVRELAKQTGKEMPALAEGLGVKVTGTYVTRTNHMVVAVVEAEGIEKVRQFVNDGRLVQWNTCEIYVTDTLEEALAEADKLPTIF